MAGRSGKNTRAVCARRIGADRRHAVIGATTQHKKRPLLNILVSFFLAFSVAMIPFPPWAEVYRPDLVSVVLIFWCVYQPARVGVVSGFASGLILDVMLGSPMGQHALAKSTIAYLASRFHKRISMFPLIQQMIVVGVLVFLDQLISSVIRGMLDNYAINWKYFLGVFVAMLFWPWLFYLFAHLRRRSNI
ncbi:MAG: rod shape-determining protein MreD [Gammaproteobacteria bacterium]|nr:MAG: rod shape-determining protein MreD [Gammaproteobacteria bacterium]